MRHKSLMHNPPILIKQFFLLNETRKNKKYFNFYGNGGDKKINKYKRTSNLHLQNYIQVVIVQPPDFK